MHVSDLKMVSHLPGYLRESLKVEAYGFHVTRIPFFHNISQIDSGVHVFLEICDRATSEMYFHTAQVVFSEHDVAGHVYVIITGVLAYTDTSSIQQLRQETCVCEPVLW